MIDTREYISNLDMPEKVTLFKELYNELAGYGIEGDTELAHVNTFEASLLKSLGGSGTINEITNLREYCKENNISHIETAGRDGWTRLFKNKGYKKYYTVLVKELENE